MHFPRGKPKLTQRFRIGCAILFVLSCAAVWYEARFSIIQSWILSNYSKGLYTTLETGPSDLIAFPRFGPFNINRGYTRIPEFVAKLERQGFRIDKQSQFSSDLLTLAELGVMLPYREPTVAGLTINSPSGTAIFDATAGTRFYKTFGEIPELIVNTLLVLEDRRLAQPMGTSSNPVINWSRLSRATLLYGFNRLGLNTAREGGSTLATQLDKFRYAADGRTREPSDKLRQIIAASIKVYKDGNDTREARKNIIVDYLNSVPLAGAPDFGEVNGLGQGLYAWFGRDLDDINRQISSAGITQQKLIAYKQVLSLLTSIRAPSYYLKTNYPALQKRVDALTRLLESRRIITGEFGSMIAKTQVPQHPVGFSNFTVDPPHRKAINLVKNTLSDYLLVPIFYDLNRLLLDVETSIDANLQKQVTDIFDRLKREAYIDSNRLGSTRLLKYGDPEKIRYSFLLYEKTPMGNELRAYVDNETNAFDINSDMKLDLGSTAKLRMLVHYLEIVHELYTAHRNSDAKVEGAPQLPNDPITVWGIRTLSDNPLITIDGFLSRALARKYSADPTEVFFTGGGIHRFQNFNDSDDSRTISVEEAAIRSVNLVFVRLARDLVAYHRSRLSYNADSILTDKRSDLRRVFLERSADEEAKIFLKKFYTKYRLTSQNQVIRKLLNKRAGSPRALTILYFAWTQVPDRTSLAAWLRKRFAEVSLDSMDKLWKPYTGSHLTLNDYGYLLGKDPLEIWTAGQLFETPELEWSELWRRSARARKSSSEWLFKTQNENARTRRLIIQIERDAFSRMAKYWRRLGYPFHRLVPSYATAIGSSADRPAALAKLMGIISNEGILRRNIAIKGLRFAEGTPYHTALERSLANGERVLPKSVAESVYKVLAATVERGTGRRVRGAFETETGTRVVAGGKTGSGDNRIKFVDKRGNMIGSRAMNRTATFAFFIGDRFHGVITAYVSGSESSQYRFTSSLPVAVLRLIAPAINERLIVDG